MFFQPQHCPQLRGVECIKVKKTTPTQLTKSPRVKKHHPTPVSQGKHSL